MQRKLKIVCIIPARLQSTRFPKKILANLAGKPLLEWVWQAAHRVNMFDDICFAIDSSEAATVIESFGGKFIMTSPHCESGTDRLIEVMQSGAMQADIWVNWQGDEPFINQQMITDLLQSCSQEDEMMWTLKKRITQAAHINALNIAKVVCTIDGFALYFSRSPIPCFRDEQDTTKLLQKNLYYKHVGIYAFTTRTLEKIATLKPSDLEDAEKLEQLRFLQNNITIKVHETEHEVMGIDTPADLARAELYAQQLTQQP